MGECRDLALLAHAITVTSTAAEMRRDHRQIVSSVDAWRRPERFTQLVSRAATRGRKGSEQDAYPQADYPLHLLAVTAPWMPVK